MRNTKIFLLSTAIAVLAAGVPLAGPATAQPAPPSPPAMRAPFMPGDLHVRIVDTLRPDLRHEVRTERPGPNYVWVGGFWHHTGTEWTWNDGRWTEPPQRNAHWIAPRYEKFKAKKKAKKDDTRTRYMPGHWSHEHLIND